MKATCLNVVCSYDTETAYIQNFPFAVWLNTVYLLKDNVGIINNSMLVFLLNFLGSSCAKVKDVV